MVRTAHDRRARLLLCAALLIGCATPVAAQQGGQAGGEGGGAGSGGPFQPTAAPKGITGDWGGARTDLADRGIVIDLRYKIQVGTNMSGGTSHAITAPGEIRLGATADTAGLIGWKGGTVRVSITRRHGASLEDKAGLDLLMQPQEVFGTGTILRLSEVSVQQSVMDGRLVFKAGRLSPSEFATFDCDFMHLGLCGAPPGNTVTRYWYVAPVVSWHGWVKARAGPAYVKAGVTEDNRNNRDRDFFLNRRGARGVLAHLELGWTPVLGGQTLPGRYQVGGWINSTADDDVLLAVDRRPRRSGEPALRRRGQYGFYVQGQQQVSGFATEDPITGRIDRRRGLNLFFNYLRNDRRTEEIVTQASAGLFVNAPFATTPLDGIGVGVVCNRYNPRAALAQAIMEPRVARRQAETAMELYYAWAPLRGALVKPNLQWIDHPGGRRSSHDVVVGGIRVDIDL